jgi:hypothetical protein
MLCAKVKKRPRIHKEMIPRAPEGGALVAGELKSSRNVFTEKAGDVSRRL